MSEDYDWDSLDSYQVKFLQSVFLDNYKNTLFTPDVKATNNMVNEINDIRTEESKYRREMDAEERRGDLSRLISNVLRQYGKGKSIDEIANWEDVDCKEVDKILKISQILNMQDPKEILLQLKQE